jgi:hypothetical protein
MKVEGGDEGETWLGGQGRLAREGFKISRHGERRSGEAWKAAEQRSSKRLEGRASTRLCSETPTTYLDKDLKAH